MQQRSSTVLSIREFFSFIFCAIITIWLIWSYRFHTSPNLTTGKLKGNHPHAKLHFSRPPSQQTVQQNAIKNKNVESETVPSIIQSEPKTRFKQLKHRMAKNAHTLSEANHPIRIAYIFAGSARSFICPKVHWSLRLNVIDAFGGEPYVFVRISEEDNMNTRTGKGNIWSPKYGSNEVNETLKILNPRKVQYFRLSDQEQEMKRNFPETIHRVFRENDLRRYSMFYHRCMGYRLAREWEEEHGMKFDWVALIRLDAAWLEPVLPIQYYANDRVWLTETGYTAFNDQFMLIPRQYSDYLYDLNTKVRKEVYCLGGPDVELWKCNKSALIERDWSNIKITENLEYCCPDVFSKNTDGYSEIIHYRHLLFGRIPISMGRLPVFITRYLDTGECYGDCPRLHYHFKDYVQESLQKEYPFFTPLSDLDSRSLSMASTDAGRCAFIQSMNHYYQPISASDFHRYLEQKIERFPLVQNIMNKSNSVQSLDYSKNLYSQFEILHPSLKLNPSEYNIWRIHPGGSSLEGCLTFEYRTQSLSWSSCDHHLEYKGGRRVDPRQAFHLHIQTPVASFARPYLLRRTDEVMRLYEMPLPNVTQIVMFDRFPDDFDIRYDFYCLAVMTDLMIADSAELSKKKSRLKFEKLRSQQIENLKQNPIKDMKITPEGLEVRMVKCNSKDPRPEELFYRVDGSSIGSHASSLVGRLRSFTFEGYCLARSPAVESGITRLAKDNKLTLVKCDDNGLDHSRVNFEFELIQA